MQIRSRILAREFKSGDRPDKAILSIVVSHSPEFSQVHVDVSRAYFHAKAQKLVLVKSPGEDCSQERTKGKLDC